VKQNYDQPKANLYLAVDAKSMLPKAVALALIIFFQKKTALRWAFKYLSCRVLVSDIQARPSSVLGLVLALPCNH
jgi:hypothetical protein